MKSYKIEFYSNHPFKGITVEYYRQFENRKQAIEWAKYWEKDCSFNGYKIIQIPLSIYLLNT